MKINVLSPSEIHAKLLDRSYPAQKSYLAMYSSWWGGVITDPGLMVVPVDDHLVHRGDGVFEAIKVVHGRAFLLQDHLQRLASSAQQISLPLPMSLEEMREVILKTTALTQSQNAVLRLYISRGPGGFTTNPYDSIASQMYLIVTAFTPYSDEKYQVGVKLGRSQVPPKEPWLAKIKTCNYLPNVMMKKESVDRKIDFTVGIDPDGFITEGSTENVVLVDSQRNLLRPRLRQILRGTTMMRSFELSQQLVAQGVLASIQEKDLTEKDLLAAEEIMMIGTTLDVLPVTEYEGKKVGTGRQGVVAAHMLKLLRADMQQGPSTTPIY